MECLLLDRPEQEPTQERHGSTANSAAFGGPGAAVGTTPVPGATPEDRGLGPKSRPTGSRACIIVRVQGWQAPLYLFEIFCPIWLSQKLLQQFVYDLWCVLLHPVGYAGQPFHS